MYGYVVMPEHIHILVNEPEQGSLSGVTQSLKQSVARTLPRVPRSSSAWARRIPNQIGCPFKPCFGLGAEAPISPETDICI